MSLVIAKKLKKGYGPQSVIEDATFSVNRGEKIALVGHNGTGKTTLLKIVAGLENQDSGTLETAKNIRIGYLAQDMIPEGEEKIGAYLQRVAKADILPHQMEIMLSGFGLGGVGLDRKLSELSSGQKSKVALAGILLKGVDLLLLDEPTNNLDLPALIWLEDFLQKSEAACIVVSHDRRFLDRVVRKIFELDWNTRTLSITGGTYSDYLQMVAKRLNRQKEEYRLQQEEVERLTNRARQKRTEATRGANWTGSDNDKFLRGFKRDQAKRSAKSAKAIEKRIEQMDMVEKPAEREPFSIPLEVEKAPGTLDIRLSEVVTGYDSGFSLGPVSLEIRFGKRVGIMGLNGTGKSTLLKTLTGNLPPMAGQINVGSGVRIGNMMQEHESLPRGETLLGLLKNRAGLSDTEAYNKLVKFGFDEVQARQLIENLSPGGRARLLLALFSAQSVNVLVLDEPTNHLDLEALAALEESLETYRGTVILVSHDRYFLEKARLDFTYLLENGKLARIPDYQTYVAQAEERARKLLKAL